MRASRSPSHSHLTLHVGTRYRVECFRHFHADGGQCLTPLTCDRVHAARSQWLEEFENLVVTTGRNRILSGILKGTSVGGAAAGYHDGGRMPTKWVASTAYTLGDVIRPTNASGQIDNNRIFIAEVAGTSNSSEPTWPSSAGGSVVDNTVTWREISVWFVGLKGAGTIAAADTMASHAGWSEITAYSQTTRPALVLGSVASGSVDNSASVAVFSINGTATVAGAFVCNLANKLGTGLLYGAGDFATARDVFSGDTLNVTATASITSS